MNYEFVEGTSKKGNKYEALKIKIGEYSALLFPTKIETIYIKTYLKKQAHKDFKGDELGDIEEEL